ncbi:MAG: hypothetical protein EOO27_00210 [Comamonadaceae bacterium]|nr:MAG: hypothetical protein EOO27_00210 [Comamonadaceae bacterium]
MCIGEPRRREGGKNVRSIGTDFQIDLKHYKSRRLALRWRTAEEVVEGIGEDTCASLRCKYHQTPKVTDTQVEFEDETRNRGRNRRPKTRGIPALRAFELPFVYNEAGERKEALVKVRLCGRCEGKSPTGQRLLYWSGPRLSVQRPAALFWSV